MQGRVTLSSFVKVKLLWLSFMVLALLTGGCASGPKADIKNIDWGSRIGTYTYEEALAELGEPNVVGETGEGMYAEWVLRQSPMVSFGFGFGGVGYGHHSSSGVGVGTSVSPPPSGEYLHLKFDRDGYLTEWTRVRY
jgi:hypothetical protein